MIPAWSYLDDRDRAVLRETVAFLNKRLAESATIDWALRLKPAQRIERLAVEDLLNGPGTRVLVEPWATAWRLIEESWSTSAAEEGPSTAIYGIQERLRAGDRSGAIISKIVSLVAPRLKVEPIDSWRWQFMRKPRRPRSFEDLLSAKLTSGGLVDLNLLELGNITDVEFLKALANTLECAVTQGLEIARRLGWDGQRRLWQLGGLGRVYYTTSVPNADVENESERDPDAYNEGIAPSIKLLHAVVSRIVVLNAPDALQFVQRWRLAQSPLHVRLWAAMAQNAELVLAEEVGAFLLGVDDDQFWDLNVFPEIAELRALRFSDLNAQDQKAIARRLRKGPATSAPKKARLYWTVRELKRIEVGGGVLPPKERAWKDAKIGQFADLVAMNVGEGFPEASQAYDLSPGPDSKYDALNGVARLRALEVALSTSRGGWNDDPAERANDWLQQIENALLVLDDLEATGNGGDAFPRVWNRFGWAHSPKNQSTRSDVQRNLEAEANRVLALLNVLADATLSAAIEGISAWMDTWNKRVVAAELGLPVWMRIWPIAVEATNTKSDNADDADLSVVARVVGDDREPMDLDTLNTPAGKLTGVFLAACPRLTAESPNPFHAGSNARQMLDTVISATGRSGLIVRHRLIEALPYFLRADRSWTEQHLIAPLLNDTGSSLALWRAIARRTHFTEVLKVIGGAMAERATDRRLGRETRRRLVFSLIIESLHAFREQREPAVPNSRIQQMLRTLDDEVRASAANAIQQFVRELSAKDRSGVLEAPGPADLFRSAAMPFLQQVWPQERSLATPGVSGAFADLPATSGEAFAEAVDAIERFLVPFECWSLLDYGLYGEDGGEKKLAIINSEAKAKALLRLLDLTIGTSEGAVIPHGLTEALDQIRYAAPELAKDPIYRRLSTAARR
ncbi:hypothetical protein [Mesorhizobium erdmanii]|uniref:hypothetical protein n=1 Tax=Mesorhizobium erdmanii TaxID=1777866 RepID=UPI000424CE80|nr:hypothetical protein [Mesorhizobium erdmanii]